MKTFIVVSEIKIDDEKYNEVKTWNVEPTDYVNSILSDHGRDRGLIMKTSVTEVDYSMFDDVNKSVEFTLKDKALEELESLILSNKACINGNCED